MPKFSKTSLQRLETCHPDLQKICNEAIKHYDFSVICGHRSKKEQDIALKNGATKLQYPKSKHNSNPSLAVDLAPYPIDWHKYERFYYLAGLIQATAKGMNIKIRWGGDWSMNGNFEENKFNDLPHFELI